MLYAILKPLANIFYRIYYKLEQNGIAQIPNNRAIVLSPNHSNGFIDPITLAILLKPKVRFFARGDIFKKKLAKWVLNDLNISPMYRLKEGYGEIKKNNEAFAECQSLLTNDKAILIFPEAICMPDKALQPLKKGLSRIVFQTEEALKFKKEVLVIPIGLNYSKATNFRSELFVNIGKPIPLKKFQNAYEDNKRKTINSFTKELENEMGKLIIVVQNKANELILDDIYEVYLHQWMQDSDTDTISIKQKFIARKEIATMINRIDENNTTLITSLKNKLPSYLQKLKQRKLRDHLLRPLQIKKSQAYTILKDLATFILGMPLYILGLSVNYLPFYISKTVVNKKIHRVEFYASIYANMAMLLWTFSFFIQLLIVALIIKNWWFLALYAILVPILGFYVLRFYPTLKKIQGRWQLARLRRNEHAVMANIVGERKEIIDELVNLKKLFHYNVAASL